MGAEQKASTAEQSSLPKTEDAQFNKLWVTFRNILIVVVLILVFAVIQTLGLQEVCNAGMKNANSLEQQGLPYLNEMADLREQLALYRLYSYECLFAADTTRAEKQKLADAAAKLAKADLAKIQSLMPDQHGGQLVAGVDQAFSELNHAFGEVKSLMDGDFSGAMKKLDQDLPGRIQTLANNARELENFCYGLSKQQANAAFGGFKRIKANSIGFGAANIVIALGAVLFVILATKRTRAQLKVTLERLGERTRELARSLSLLNATLDSTADGILAIDNQDRVLCFNQQFTKIWGFYDDMINTRRVKELITLCSVQTVDPDRFLNRLENYQALTEAEVLDAFEFKDGRIVECFARPQVGGLGGVVLCFRDITRRKQAEAKLDFERNLLEALLAKSADCIYFKDLQSRFIRGSASLAAWFKVPSAEELVGRRDSDFFESEHAAEAYADEQRIIQTGEPMIGKVEKEVWPDGRVTWALSSKMPFLDRQGVIIGTIGISKDVTAIKEAEAKLAVANKQLLDASRQAGMAEVATSVLHNVGNVLNSVNVSSSLIGDTVRGSKVANVGRVADLIRANEADLGGFLTQDPKGKKLPGYLANLAGVLVEEQKDVLRELASLSANIQHIKEIVAMQQSYAKTSGVSEVLQVVDLVEDAVRMNNAGINRHQINLVREFAALPPVATQKHKVLQILVNLIRNAKHACDDSGRTDKQITLRLAHDNGRVKISVADNGVGIPAENLTRIFGHGFTTRKEGHGFGLHSGALAAKELGGALCAASPGPGLGATFTLELPVGNI